MARGQGDPAVRKGAIFPFQVSAVAWVDLLGYGRMIADAHFNPLHPKSEIALKRLRAFHRVVSENSSRAFPTLVMNDGAAAYRDLSMRSSSVTYQFIVNAWNLFQAISKVEANAGHPGPRMVISTGFRMRGRRAGMDQSAGHFASVMERFQVGKITAEQAIREASRITRSFDVIPQLQANFAFTKAYVAESSGKGGGLAGARCFLDLAFFDEVLPPWIKLEPAITWNDERLGLEAEFAPIADLPKFRHRAGEPVGLRDGLQIAQHLAGGVDVLAALHSQPRLSPRD